MKIPCSKLRTGNLISHQGHLFVATKTIEKRFKSKPIQMSIEMKNIRTGKTTVEIFAYDEPIECLNKLNI